jgi:hypothetical protein
MPRQDQRRHAPATSRNRDPILKVLQAELPPSGLVLEVASGSGEHAVFFAAALPRISWRPSDASAAARRSILAWIESAESANVLPPLALDAAVEPWPIDRAAAVVCINMIHISPWESAEGLMRGAGRILANDEPLILYGPFRRGDRPLEPSNEAFDRDLRGSDPRWGLRELDEVADCAKRNGLRLARVVEMPANNLSVIFRKMQAERAD